MPNLSQETYDVTIMGTGPAGLTAAIYTGRADLKTVMFEGDLPGGQLTQTSEVENYPGFERGIPGMNLINEMREQARRFGAEIHFAMIKDVDFSQRPFTVNLDDGTSFKTHTFIIASGASPRKLGLEGESLMWGNGVSSCATCDGFFFKDQEIVVVGGGDSAMEEATFLTKFASKVTIVHRREELRASKIMQERALKNPKIEWKLNHVITAVHGNKQDGVTGLTLQSTENGEEYEFPTNGLFLGIGHTPNTSIFTEELEMDEEGYIKTAPDSTKTNIPGVFAVGDVQDKVYRQAITAAGTGCMGALEAEHYLAELFDGEAAAE
ncbi:MAG: thioredoxin-disulfide reductase [Myxococcota bacterium]|jgi:thioredoxin reductase (NADPH)|nr:thioredoxin-disulfide reductase [Myxococcota bacterium]